MRIKGNFLEHARKVTPSIDAMLVLLIIFMVPKPVRPAPLVYALSALITVLGGYWLLARVFVA
jgi:hypothetical protein